MKIVRKLKLSVARCAVLKWKSTSDISKSRWRNCCRKMQIRQPSRPPANLLYLRQQPAKQPGRCHVFPEKTAEKFSHWARQKSFKAKCAHPCTASSNNFLSKTARP